nr:hypothetical protein [uncultured bacterium]
MIATLTINSEGVRQFSPDENNLIFSMSRIILRALLIFEWLISYGLLSRTRCRQSFLLS